MSLNPEGGTLSEESTVSIRELALRCGDIHAAMMQLLPTLAKLSEDELVHRGEADLAKLRSRGRLTDVEMDQLRDVLRVIRADASPRERAEKVEEIYQQMRAPDGSPVAMALAAIAADSSRSFAQRAEEAGSVHLISGSEGAVVAADVVGGIAGAFLGDALCGALCAVMGGAAGAAGLSIVAQEHL
jgi:hypothetical protein